MDIMLHKIRAKQLIPVDCRTHQYSLVCTANYVIQKVISSSNTEGLPLLVEEQSR